MKRFLALLLSMLILVSLAACGGKDSGKDEEKDSAPQEDASGAAQQDPEPSTEQEEPPAGQEEPDEQPEEQEEPPAPEITSYSLQSVSSFSDGAAFIRFRDDANGVNCSGIIDGKGKLQYYFVGNTQAEDQNKNGYMYSREDKTFYVITPKGKVVTHELSDDVQLMVYGDGYVVTQEKKSGFEAVEYIYHIYDDSGKELTTYSSGANNLNGLTYVGEGTFLFYDRECQNDAMRSYGYYTICRHLYFAKSDTWHKNVVLSDTGSAINNYSYQDGIFMIRGATQNGNDNTHPGEFTYVNDQGAVQTLTVPADYGTQPHYLGHKDGVMIFYDNQTQNKQVYRYDVKEKSWAGYQGKYTEQMVIDYSYPPVTGDGYAALCLRGADNKYYTTLVDKSMKDVVDSPVLGFPYCIQDGVLYTYNNSNGTLCCYDMKGKQLSEISNLDVYRNWYDEGIIFTYDREFLKPDGTPAFEVSYSGAKQIILK